MAIMILSAFNFYEPSTRGRRWSARVRWAPFLSLKRCVHDTASVQSVQAVVRIGRCIILDLCICILTVRFVQAYGDVRQRIALIISYRFYRNNIFLYRRQVDVFRPRLLDKTDRYRRLCFCFRFLFLFLN